MKTGIIQFEDWADVFNPDTAMKAQMECGMGPGATAIGPTGRRMVYVGEDGYTCFNEMGHKCAGWCDFATAFEFTSKGMKWTEFGG